MTVLILWVLRIPLSRPGKISPSNVYQDWHWPFNRYRRAFLLHPLQKWGLKKTEKVRTEDSNNKHEKFDKIP